MGTLIVQPTPLNENPRLAHAREAAKLSSLTGTRPEEPKPNQSVSEGGFLVDDSGVFYIGQGSKVRVCSTLHVDAMTRDEHSTNWGRKLRWRDSAGVEHVWAMPMASLSADGAEVRAKLLRDGVSVEGSKKAREHLQQYLQRGCDRTMLCTSRVGWHRGSFVLPDRMFGLGNEEEVIFQSQHLQAFEALTTKGTLEGWRGDVAGKCSGNSRLVFAASAGFVGPLIRLANEDGGGFHYVGSSSIGKTTALYVCGSVVGSPTGLRSWRSTSNGLESTAEAHNDLTLVLDELAQMNAAEAADVAYLLANGLGKNRMSRHGSVQPQATWKLVFLSTGELTLSEHAGTAGKHLKAGSEIRLLNIAADAGKGLGLFENLHGLGDGGRLAHWLKDSAASHYGHPIREFLRQLIASRSHIEHAVRDFIRAFVDEHAAEASSEVQRAAKRFALVAKAGELATDMGITGWSRGEATQAAVTCFASFLQARGTTGESDVEAGCRNVFGFIERYGDSRFQPLQFGNCVSQRTVHNRAGFVRQTEHGFEYLFLADVFRNEVCKGVSYEKVAQQLLKNKMLRRDADRLTKKERLPVLGPRNVYVVLMNPDPEMHVSE